MAPLKAFMAGLALMMGVASAADDMGPAAFMWPPDRVWSAAADNTAPCGSIASPANRTKFPLTNGKIALVAQDESFDLVLSVSYLQDPKSNTDFNTLIEASAFRELDLGHTCVPVANAPSSVKAGANATLQMKFISQFDKPENETFYACADITYVELSDFDVPVPCFNATQPPPSKGGSGGQPGSSTPTPAPSPGSSGLSGGAIAGIVVGCVAAIGLVAGAVFLVYRRKQQRLNALRQQHSARGVKWDQPERESGSVSSVRMQNLQQ